jgi:hypothetical protein
MGAEEKRNEHQLIAEAARRSEAVAEAYQRNRNGAAA